MLITSSKTFRKKGFFERKKEKPGSYHTINKCCGTPKCCCFLEAQWAVILSTDLLRVYDHIIATFMYSMAAQFSSTKMIHQISALCISAPVFSQHQFDIPNKKGKIWINQELKPSHAKSRIHANDSDFQVKQCIAKHNRVKPIYFDVTYHVQVHSAYKHIAC